MTRTPFAFVAAAATHLLPVGYVFDCKSWPGGVPAKSTVTLVAPTLPTLRDITQIVPKLP